MSVQSTAPHPERTYAVVLVVVAAGAAAGFWMSLTSREMPGSEALTLEDAVDVVAILLFGILGVALVARRRAAGLGRALVLMSTMICLDYLLHGVGDALAGGDVDPPAVARVLYLAGESTFVVAFFLLALAPMLLFPTGRLPSRRWRWPAGAAVLGCGLAVLSVLLAPGPVDEDVRAWGDNPIGLDAAPGVVDGLELCGFALLAVGLATGLAAFVSRWVPYPGPRRRQLAWFTLGVVVQGAGLIVDTNGKSLLIEVLLALGIFGTLLVGIGWPLLGPLGREAEERDHLLLAHSVTDGDIEGETDGDTEADPAGVSRPRARSPR